MFRTPEAFSQHSQYHSCAITIPNIKAIVSDRLSIINITVTLNIRLFPFKATVGINCSYWPHRPHRTLLTPQTPQDPAYPTYPTYPTTLCSLDKINKSVTQNHDFQEELKLGKACRYLFGRATLGRSLQVFYPLFGSWPVLGQIPDLRMCVSCFGLVSGISYSDAGLDAEHHYM